jgi:hypothetical protein
MGKDSAARGPFREALTPGFFLFPRGPAGGVMSGLSLFISKEEIVLEKGGTWYLMGPGGRDFSAPAVLNRKRGFSLS